MRLSIISLLLILSSAIQAQVKYSGNVEGGLVNGNFSTSSYVQTKHGIEYKHWVVGVGAGMDYYRYRTVPLYVELQRSFGKNSVRPFAVIAAGVNATWPTEEQKQETNGWLQRSPAVFSNGFYSRLGGGVLLTTNSKVKISITAAYSYKTLSRTYSESNWDMWPQPVNIVEKTIEYRMNRLSIGLGVSF